MTNNTPHQAAREIVTDLTSEELQTFRDQADTDWEVEMAEEMRLRKELLPGKEIPFPSPITHPEIIIEEHVEITMRDGVILRCDVYRPKAEGKFPVLINRGPYDRASTLDYTPSVMRSLAKRGWVAIAQDVRGRYGSDGEFVPFGEIEDGGDTVEWAGTQSWSTGKVGMFGISYNGWTCLTAAMSQTPYLKAIFPGMMEYGFRFRETGVPALQGLCAWHIWAGQGQEMKNPLRIDLNHLPLTEIDDNAGYPNPQFDAMVTMEPNFDILGEFTPELINERLAKIETNTYYALGWYDVFVEGTIDTWQQIRKTNPSAKIMIGPYHHNLCDMDYARMGKVPTGEMELLRYYADMEMFFAQHLKNEENRVSKSDAPMNIYVMGRNQWRDEYEWPLARTEFKPLYFHSNGQAGTDLESGVLDWVPPQTEQAADEFNYDPLNPVTWSADLDIWTFLDEMSDRNEVESRDDVLVYSTSALQEDLEVTGPINVKLFAASDAQDTDFVATLVDVHPDGHTQFLTSGIVRARYRNGVDKPELIEPGKIYEYDIKLQSTSNVFLKGHKLRVEITSSDFNRHARNQNVADAPGHTSATKVAHQSIRHSGAHLSHIVLPVIPDTTAKS